MAVVTVTAVVAWFVIPPSPARAPGRLNLRAATLLAAWLVALLVPLSKAPSWGWTSPSVLGLFLASAVLAGTWVAVELHSAEPLIDMRLMGRPAIWTTNLVALLFGASMFATYAFLPQFLQIPRETGFGLGATVTESGLIMLPMLVTMALAGFGSGPLTRILSARSQLAIGASLTTVSTLAIAGFHTDRWEIALDGGVFGIGLGLAFSAMVNLVVQSVPSHQTGVASGMNTNLRTVGGAIGAAVFSTIVTSHLAPGGLPTERGYTTGFLALAALALGALAVALIVPRPAPQPDPAQAPQPHNPPKALQPAP
jgi:predicted MFS family arabinose efflux permease